MSSFRPFILIPSYNTGGALLRKTVEAALTCGLPVRVMIDGSTDGSESFLDDLRCPGSLLEVWRQPTNQGKGAAVRSAAEQALAERFTHAVAMDADGQHPSAAVTPLVEAARTTPAALIMGHPQFGADAPKARLYGRKLTIFWTNLETMGCGLGDTLFGMRVYPLVPLLAAFRQTSFARGFDFDPEIAVRMCWLGCPIRQIPVRCRYLSLEAGGVSHFHYMRDNLKLIWLHFRLVPEFILWRLWLHLFGRGGPSRG